MGLLVLGVLAGLQVPARASEATASKAKTVMIYGDSLSAAYGLSVREGWVHLLSEEMGQVRVINRSLSGETTYGGLQRLERILRQQPPDVFVLALGANDGLRGLPMQKTEENLRAMLQLARAAGAKTVILGIQLPPNFGAHLNRGYEEMFRRLARQTQSGLVPFMLESFALDTRYFQADRIHPTAEAQPLILKTVRPAIVAALQKAR